MKKNKIFKMNLLLMLTIVMVFSTAQGFAATPRATAPKTKISTVDWNKMSLSPYTHKKSDTNLYWFKFAFLDKSMSSGTIQEICTGEFNQLKSDMRMPGYFFPIIRHHNCPPGEYYGMGIIFRGKELAHQVHVFKDQATPTQTYGKGALGMICVKHSYLNKKITSCVTHLDFPKVTGGINNNWIGIKQLKQYTLYGTLFDIGAGGKNYNKSDVIFLNGDFNQLPNSVAGSISGYKSTVVANTHNALSKNGPSYQLDYILVPNNLQSSPTFEPACNLGSDHCMIGASVWH